MRKKRIWAAAMALVTLCCAALPARAASNARIVGVRVSNGEIQAFIKGGGSASSAEASLGQNVVGTVDCQSLRDAGSKLCTFILIDNSLSIPEETRPALKDELRELVAARQDGERFALGTVSSEVTVLQDFTDEYTALANALEDLEFQYQDTFITDALYDYLSGEPFQDMDNCLVRILLVSDGMDNKQLGYTKDELVTLLNSNPTQIYSLGVTSYNETSEDDLKNMFSLARASGGETCLLEELGEDQLVELMQAEWSDLTVTVPVPGNLRDGGLQTLTLALSGGATVTVDQLRMPLEAAQAIADPEATETPAPAPEPLFPVWGIILIAAGALLVIVAIVVTVILVTRSKKKREAERRRLMELQKQGNQFRTVFVNSNGNQSHDSNSTLMIWGNNQLHTVTLFDTHNPQNVFQKPIETALIIGNRMESDICISYDRTVSGTHCRISLEGGSYYLENLSNTNGTLLNKVRVTAKTPVSSGDVITMGNVEMRLEFDR